MTIQADTKKARDTLAGFFNVVRRDLDTESYQVAPVLYITGFSTTLTAASPSRDSR